MRKCNTLECVSCVQSSVLNYEALIIFNDVMLI
uniref:Uncharacterized protein n=1 Tax=Anguilla anguilla TaxID=7936 RepID=A0A0E9QER8_ANGAN